MFLPSATAAYHAKKEAARKAEGRQEAHATIGTFSLPSEAFMSVASHQHDDGRASTYIFRFASGMRLCDFVSFPNGSVPEPYADAFTDRNRACFSGGSYPAAFDTVFSAAERVAADWRQMRRIMSALRERFDIRAEAEISMEATPARSRRRKAGCLSRSGHQPSLDRAAEHT